MKSIKRINRFAAALLAALLLSSCGGKTNTDAVNDSSESVPDSTAETTAAHDAAECTSGNAPKTGGDSASPAETAPAAGETDDNETAPLLSAPSWSEICAAEARSQNGYWRDSWKWAAEYVASEHPAFDCGEFDFEAGATSDALSDEYDVVSTLWRTEDKTTGKALRIMTIEFTCGGESRPAAVFETERDWSGYGLRDICDILNADPRFDGFVYPEPVCADGTVAVNLTEIKRGLAAAYPQEESFEFLNYADKTETGYRLFFGSASRRLAALISESGEFISAEEGMIDNAEQTAETISRDGWSLRTGADGGLTLYNLHDGRECFVAARTDGENVAPQNFRNPVFWRFDADGKLLYHVYGWEYYMGLGVCDPESGDNRVLSCHEPLNGSGDIIFTASRYDDAEGFKLWRLDYSGREWSETELALPETVTANGYPDSFLLYVDGSRLAVLCRGEDAATLTLMKFSEDASRAIPTATAELDARVTSPQYLHLAGGMFVVGCERHALCDEYAYLVPLA